MANKPRAPNISVFFLCLDIRCCCSDGRTTATIRSPVEEQRREAARANSLERAKGAK